MTELVENSRRSKKATMLTARMERKNVKNVEDGGERYGL